MLTCEPMTQSAKHISVMSAEVIQALILEKLKELGLVLHVLKS